MNVSELIELIGRLPRVRVLCVGDIMLDRFVYGGVKRISPEAPVPVLRTDRSHDAVGGVGNVANNLRALGADVSLVSIVGEDDEATSLRTLLVANECDATLLVDQDRPTSQKTRFIAEGQQMLRVDRESTADISPSLSEELAAAVSARLPTSDVVIVSDYAKGVLTSDVLRSILKQAKQTDTPVFVDPKGGDYARYAGASLLTPNAKELEEISNIPIIDDGTAERACTALMASHDIGSVLVTRGAQGMTLATRADGPIEFTHLPAEAREVYDVSGAGDTVIAAIAATSAARATLAEAAHLSNLAAGMVVEKVGTAVVTAAELVSALHRHAGSPDPRRVLSLDDATERADTWRRAGLKVGFTNGCFDLIHPGHLSLLDQAARACDRLIVALNDDASVARLKGPQRPVQSEYARAAVLASLEMVDAVLLFSGDTPLAEITSIRPDVLVKGADYTEETVVGADVVKGYGGKIVLAKLVDGFSTTATIAGLDAP